MIQLSLESRVEQIKKQLTPRLLELMATYEGEQPIESNEALREQYEQFIYDYFDPTKMTVDVPGRVHKLADGTTQPFQIHFTRKEIDFCDIRGADGHHTTPKNPVEAMLFGADETGESRSWDYVIDAEKTDMSTLTHMSSLMHGGDRFGSQAGVLYSQRQYDATGNLLDIDKKIVT